MQLFSLIALATFAFGAPSPVPAAQSDIDISVKTSEVEAGASQTTIQLEGYQETIKSWFVHSKTEVEKIKITDGRIYAYHKETEKWELGESITIDKTHRISGGAIEEYHNFRWRLALDYEIDTYHHAVNGLVCFWNSIHKTWEKIELAIEILIIDTLHFAGHVVDEIVEFFELVEHKVEDGLIYIWNESKKAWELAEDVVISASYKIVKGVICVWNATTKAFEVVVELVIDAEYKIINGLICVWNKTKLAWVKFEKGVVRAGKKLKKELKKAGKVIAHWLKDIEHKIEDGVVYVYNKAHEAWELAEDIVIDATHKIIHGVVCVFHGVEKAWVAVEDFVIDETHKVINGLIYVWNETTKAWEKLEEAVEAGVAIIVEDLHQAGETIKAWFHKAGHEIKDIEHRILNGLVYTVNLITLKWELTEEWIIDQFHKIHHGEVFEYKQETDTWVRCEEYQIDTQHRVIKGSIFVYSQKTTTWIRASDRLS